MVKIYDWKALTKLACDDLHSKTGMDYNKVHSVSGLDVNGEPYIRLDFTPLDKPSKT